MAVLLPQPVALLGFANAALGADPASCYAVDVTAGETLTVSKASGATSALGSTGATVRGAAFGADGTTVHAAAGATLGTIDTSSGSFSAVAAMPGVADVHGMTVDPETAGLYVLDGGAGNVLRRVDPTDGSTVAGGVGGADTRAVTGVVGVIGDIALAPTTGTLYATDPTGAGDTLVTVDLATGSAAPVAPVLVPDGAGGSIPVLDVDGLSFTRSGVLLATTASGQVLRIDPATATATELATVAADLQALACASEPGNLVAGTVFVDDDRDGTLGATEAGLAGVPVVLQRSGATVQTTATDTDGAYRFDVGLDRTYTVTVDAADLPVGSGPTTPLTRAADLTALSSATGLDIGAGYASIGGTVFDDLDGDGVQGPTEPGLAGIDVTVAGATSSTTVTSATDGSYDVQGLVAGDHTVTVDPAAGPGPLTTPVTRTLTLAAAEDRNGVDHGYDGSAEVAGLVFDDLDRDGLPGGPGEIPLSGVVVEVVDATTTTVIATATSAGDGTYLIGDLPARDVLLQVDPASVPDGGTVTTTSPFSATLTAGATTTYDVGIELRATVGGRVFDDLDGDGVDAAEPGLAGVGVRLLDSAGAQVATATTAGDGTFVFGDLAGDTYTVSVDPTAGPGGVPATTPTDVTVTVGPIEADRSTRIGFDGGASLRGVVYDDVDRDATLGASDVPLAGVTVRIRSGGATVATATSGADGRYAAGALPSGSYSIDVDPATLPAGATTTTPLPIAVALAPGEDLAGVDVGVDTSVTLRGRAFSDRNADGALGAGEPGIVGLAVTVADDATGTVLGTTTTNLSGRWTLEGMPRRAMTVTVTPPDGATLTTANASQTVTPTQAGPLTVSPVGYAFGAVAGTVFGDLDDDGVQDADESGLSGVSVRLRDSSGAIIAIGTTSATGGYRLNDIPAGDHTLSVNPATLPGGATAPAPTPATVTAGSTTAIDVAVDTRASVAGVVWNDLDGDGTRGASEPGIAGATVVATDPTTGAETGRATTTSLGTYVITGLRPGDHRIAVDRTTLPSATAVRTNADTGVLTLGVAERRTAVDHGFDLGGSVAGTVWNDVDGDGAIDVDEPGYPGVTVELRDASGGALVATTVTGPAGGYGFDRIAAGTYDVLVVVATLPAPTAPPTGANPRRVTVSSLEDVVGADLGFDGGASVAGTVWNDLDGDGVRQPSEPALDGVRITVTDGSGALVGSSTSGPLGAWSVGDLVPGSVTVAVDPATVPPGATVSRAPTPATFTLATAEARTGLDVGVEAPVALAGRIFNDLDGDGIDDPDPGLEGVEIVLRDASGVEVDRVTVVTGTGSYRFGELAPGAWSVTVDAATVPTGAPLTTGASSFSRTLGPGEDVTGLDVGYGAGASIEGVLFDDVDGDRLRDASEPGLVGTTIEARAAGDGSLAAVATVVADGGFTLDGLAPGTYDVVLASADGSSLATAGYVRRTLDDPVTVTVAAAESAGGVVIGYWKPASIAVELFDDVDGDGTRTAPEPGHAAVDVVLSTDPNGDGDAADGAVVTTLATDATGAVTFDELPPGGYVVDADLPARTIITVGEDPIAVAVAPGETGSVLTGTQAYAPAVSATTPPAATGEAGDEVAHPVSITNDGNVTDVYTLTASSDQGATVTLLRDVDGDGVRDPEDTVVMTATAPVAPGGSAALLVVVTVPSGLARGTVDATVLDITSTIDPTVATSVTITTTVIAPVLDVAIVSGLGAGFIVPGETVPYTVTVANRLPDADVSDARDVTVEVELADPTHGEVEPGSIAIDGVAQPGASFPITLALLPAGATTEVTFDLRAARPLADGTAVTAVARVVAIGNPEGDPREATAATTDVVDSSPIPELGVSSSPSSGTIVQPGDVITYTVVVGDRTDATATWEGVTLVADLPPELIALDATVDGVPAGTVFPPGAAGALPDLEPGDLVRVVLRAQVADPVDDATALAAIFEVDGANAGPLVAATTHTVRVDRAVILDPDRSGRGPAGSTVAHPHVLRNDGNVSTVFDLTATTDQGWPSWLVDDLDADGVLDAGEPVITATGPVAGGSQRHLLSVVEVPSTEPDGVTGTTTVATFAADGFPVLDQVLNVTEVVAPVLGVEVAPSPSSTVVNRGQRITYAVTVRNSGAAVARGVTFTDVLPTAGRYVAGSTRRDGAPLADAPGGRSPVEDGLVLGDLPAGGSTVISFEVDVTAVDDGTALTNRATATDAEARVASDSTVQIVAASPVIDLTLTSSPAGPTVRAGRELTYTAVVSNVGSLDATGVTVTGQVPGRTLYVPGSTTLDGAPVADRGGATALAGGLTVGSLAPGATRVIRFRVTVLDPVLGGEEIRAVATATSDQGVSATPPAVVLRTAVQPNVAVTGSGSKDVARPGQAAYGHTITNTGDVTDSFTLTARSSQGWRVSILRDDDRDGAWDPTREVTPMTATGPLSPGASVRVIVVIEVAAEVPLGTIDTTTLTVRSLVSPTVSRSTSDRTRATAPALDLSISSIPSGQRVNPGQTITYVTAVRNLGAAPATDVVVRGATPSGTTYVPDSTTRNGQRVPDGTSADGNPIATGNGGVAIPSIAAGGEVVVTYAVVVPAATPSGQTIVARVEASAADTAVETAEKRHTVAPGPVLDVQVAADPPSSEATPAGTRITYTVTVANTGQEIAKALRLVDDTPRDTTYVAGSATRNGAVVADGRTDPNPFSSVYGGFLLGDVAAGGAPITLRFQVVVDDPVPVGALVENVAVARSGDLEARSAVLVHSLAVTPAATVTPNLSVNAVPGGFADLAHVVTNSGDVTDAFSLTATSENGWVASVISDLDANGLVDEGEPVVTATPVLRPGERTPIIVRVAVPPTALLDTQDAVLVQARSSLDQSRGGAAADTVRVVANALRLVADARPSTLAPGGTSTYRLTLSNVGRSPIVSVTLLDAVPDGTTYVEGSTTRDGRPVPDSATGGSPLAAGLDLGSLAPGVDTVLEFQVEVDPTTTLTRIVNSALVRSLEAPTVRAGTVQAVSRQFGFDLRGTDTRTASPGTTVTYPHELVGTGLVPDQVDVSARSSLAAPAAVHVDLDGDGELDADDPVLAGPVDLAPGEVVRLLAVVTYPSDTPAGVDDTVSITARSVGDTQVEATVSDTTRISGATVTVTASVAPDGDVAAGDLLTYDLVVRNDGVATIGDLTLVADAPAATVYEPGSATIDGSPVPDADGATNPFGSAAGGTALGELSPGATRVVRLAARVADGATAGTVLSVAGVVTTATGAITSNTVRTTVIDRTGVQVLKQASPGRVVEAGERITWTLTVTNEGERVASEVVLSDPPVAGTRYVPGTTTIDGRAAGDGIVADTGLPLGDLGPGALVAVAFQTVVDVPGAVVQNIATLRHSGGAAQVLSNLAAVEVGAARLPATGVPAGRTLGGATALLLAGWALLFVARPERRSRAVLVALRRG